MTRLGHAARGAAIATLVAVLGFNCAGIAAPLGQDLVIPAAEHSVPAQFYPASGDVKRPAVVILHGAEGVEKFATDYRRYAAALSGFGFDTYLISYYTAADADAMNSPDMAHKFAWRDERFPSWMKLVGDVVAFAAARPNASGRVGLVGFSNGGYLAAASAAFDPRVSALVVFYGGIRGAVKDSFTRLPPLLELHGDADRNAPLSDGTALVQLARAFGGHAEQIVYPGEGHGFDFNTRKPASADAMGRMLAFLSKTLEGQ